MFTEELEPRGLGWIQEDHSFDLNRQKGIDSLHETPNGGHLPPSSIPMSVLMEDDTDSSSYLYDSSEIEEDDVSERRMRDGNSVGASASASASIVRCGGAVHPRHRDARDVHGYSYFSVLSETKMQQPQPQREQGNFNGYAESLSSDSGGSIEFGQTIERRNGGVGVVSQRNANVGSYFCRSPQHEYVELDDKNDDHSNSPNALLPFEGCDQEIIQTAHQLPVSRSCDSTCSIGSDGSFGEQALGLQANTRNNVLNLHARSTSDGSFVGKALVSQVDTRNRVPNSHGRSTSIGVEASAPSCSLPVRVPSYHASLKQILLQSEEELLNEQSSELVGEGLVAKPKRTIGKIKVQVRKVRISLNLTPGCNFSALKRPTVNLGSLHCHLSKLQSTLSSVWKSLQKIHVLRCLPANGSSSQHKLAYLRSSVQYIKKVSRLLKLGAISLQNSLSFETANEMYSYHLRLKSSTEDGVIMHPGETHLFFASSLADDLIVEVYNSRGKLHGLVIAQLASFVENSGAKLRWWSIYRKTDHKHVGKILLDTKYMTNLDENNTKCGSVAETVAYDIVLEVAMKVQQFQERQLLLHGEWKWLLTEFASYFGVSDAYTKLRYLSYLMDVATPTADCLVLVYDFLLPVIMKNRNKNTLSHQENRMLGEIEEQIEQVLAMVFKNYKSLDESLPSGLVEDFRPSTGSAAPALLPAMQLYTLLHDILLPEEQFKLCNYFQAAVEKRSRRHLVDSDKFLPGNSEGCMTDVVTLSAAYQKMKTLCFNMRNEILTDIEIHNQHLLPSFIDLPNLSASIYSTELCSRLRAFLVACPPTSPSSDVIELLIATADFQNDLNQWNICPVKGGLDAKGLFHMYIISWIQDRRISLLDLCKFDKVKCSGLHTQHQTTPFIDEIYDQLRNTLSEYKIVICLWPEYTFVLENAIADIAKAVIKALERQHADVLAPLKCCMTSKKFGMKYVQKFAQRNSICLYIVPDELGIFLNSIKSLYEVTVMLRAKFRNYIQAVGTKLAGNAQLHSDTKLKKIIQDTNNIALESDIHNRMQPLKEQLIQTINHLHTVFEDHVFVMLCRSYWDQMGQGVLNFLEKQKGNKSWYNASKVAVTVLEETIASQMQQLVGVGNALQKEDLEPPKSVMEVISLLCNDESL
ncbi:hypothetical protein J5N97_003071 [Dioscorea zingiberensis]|uniref:Uncharacterized protein n=1 Tax=Dioscorea zingiberensis TaxID=325984 RepID=A0A9D5D613_9LILI|nr:hypothetical protein J5N97_003071 [Dioscorea zingiberensis]